MATLKGKRLRPALILLVAKASGRWNEQLIDTAVAVEMIHAATMAHDDVVDSATVRRGRETVNERWTGQIAVLMGDFLLARALRLLIEVGNLQVLSAVAHATERLSMGEIFEIQIGTQCDTCEESYLAMVSDKTASLISAAARIGAILAGAPDEIVQYMGRYGESLGRAFQVADDILDLTSDQATMGQARRARPARRQDHLATDTRLTTGPLGSASRDGGPFGPAGQGRSRMEADSGLCRRVPRGRRRRRNRTRIRRPSSEMLRSTGPFPGRAALERAVQLVVERNN